MSIPKLVAVMEKYASQLQRWAQTQQYRLRVVPDAEAAVNMQPMGKIKPIPSVVLPPMKEEVIIDKKISEEATNVDTAEAMKTQPDVEKSTMDTEFQPAALKTKPGSLKSTATGDKPEGAQPFPAEK